MDRSKLLAFVLFSCLFVCGLSVIAEGAVWTVDFFGGGDFNQIQPAIDAASDGDTILLTPNAIFAFEPCLIDNKTLNLVNASSDQTVSSQGIFVVHLATHRRVLISGVTVFHQSMTPVLYMDGVYLENNLGSIRIEDCDLQGCPGINSVSSPQYHPDAFHGLSIHNCLDVAVTRSQLKGGDGPHVYEGGGTYPPGRGGNGIHAVDSTVALYDCACTGGPGGSVGMDSNNNGADGGCGSALDGDAVVFASGCLFEGGQGGSGGQGSDNNAPGDGADGGHGIHLDGAGSPLFRSLNCAFLGGEGGYGGTGYGGYPDGEDGDPGEATLVDAGTVLDLPGRARSFEMPYIVRENESADLTFTGLPGDRACLVLSVSPDYLYVPDFHGALLVSLAPVHTVIFWTVLPSSGTWTVTVPIPDQGPGFEAMGVYMQSAFVEPAGAIYLGPPRTLVAVDDAY